MATTETCNSSRIRWAEVKGPSEARGRTRRAGWLVSTLLVATCLPTFAVASDSAAASRGDSTQVDTTWIVEVNQSRPIAYQDDEGNWAGFEIDRLNLVASASGRRVEYRPLSNPDRRFQALADERADIVLGGNTITAEREAKSINFTYPTFDSGLAIAVPWNPGKESGSRLMAVTYAYAHWEIVPLGLAAFVLACIFFVSSNAPSRTASCVAAWQ